MKALNGSIRIRGILKAAGLAVFLFASLSAEASEDSMRTSPKDMAMLPPYCPYTFYYKQRIPGAMNPEHQKLWRQKLGDTFQHLHHYCWALQDTYDAIGARSAQERAALLKRSVTEFDYVLRGSAADFVLLPEILTKKGENLIKLGSSGPGLASLVQAIEVKADYWPPYAQLSDYFKQAGDIAKAREFIEKALAFAPDSKSLRTRLDELDKMKANPPRTAAPAASKSPEPATPGTDAEKPAIPPKPAK